MSRSDAKPESGEPQTAAAGELADALRLPMPYALYMHGDGTWTAEWDPQVKSDDLPSHLTAHSRTNPLHAVERLRELWNEATAQSAQQSEVQGATTPGQPDDEQQVDKLLEPYVERDELGGSDLVFAGYSMDVFQAAKFKTDLKALIASARKQELEGVQIYTDPKQPKGITPFKQLKAADEYIRARLDRIKQLEDE